ncbi:uracil-DNA glycosylase [Paracoccus sediminis]|uniref:Uracil DNA glycosylase superfamily protein n=2 Tax=Paracoccus sediminis TaxID=1214787 RepID=A0A238VWS3_9RHOB|nr:uracil-DNA glycosylase [Paracoccus sediminis]SNR38587.1 Uracil DNA glycosylase superfamily protein [Paracoccus sediminis]
MTLDDPWPQGPRALKDTDAVKMRHALRADPHIAPLASYVDALRAENRGYVPDFDPLDGGVDAEILFLLEKPGPKTDPANGGSGFISRDNDDPSAEATYRFMELAQVPRRASVIWNAIPWWNETTEVSPRERSEGMLRLSELLRLLPHLRSVVLVGNNAKKARSVVEATGMQVFESAHPSAQVRGANRRLWDQIPDQWRRAYQASNTKFTYTADSNLSVEAKPSPDGISEQTLLERVRAAQARYEAVLVEYEAACAELRQFQAEGDRG